MLDFLKRLFNNQDKDLTFVLFDDEEPESSTSYHFRPSHLWKLFYGSLVVVATLTLLLVMFTPLGALMYNRADAQLRERVIDVSKKVRALQDSLDARDTQLSEMQQVISSGADTAFSVGQTTSLSQNEMDQENRELDAFSEVPSRGMLSQNEILFSKMFKKVPEFPADYPIEGTLTRGYNPENGHYGIDIATKQGTPFKAIADGAIINQDWTIDYGFVLHVQHSNGIITVYKHA